MKRIAATVGCMLALVTCALACGGHTTRHTPPVAVPKDTPAQIAGNPPCATANYFMQCGAGATGIKPPTGLAAPFGRFGVDTYGNPALGLSAGYVVTYVPYSGKGWTRAGLQAWVRRGKQAGIVFEASAARAEDGYAQGVADARYSLSYANYLGFPSYSVIYFAVDAETSAASVAEYFRGVHSILGSRTGVYGSYYVVSGLENAYHLVTPRSMWQTVAWSYGHRSNACLYQSSINDWLDGQSVDFDYATCADFGQFPFVKPDPERYANYDNVRRTFRQQNPADFGLGYYILGRARERNTVQTWDKHGCRNPVRRSVCKSSRYHMVLLRGRLTSLHAHGKPWSYGKPASIGARNQELWHRINGRKPIGTWAAGL